MLKFLLLLTTISYFAFSQYDVARIRSPYLNEYKELEKGPNDLLWVGTWGAGIKKSTDMAVTWTTINNGLTDLYITDINYKDGILLAGTYGGGVFKSTNEGANWTAINTGLYNLKVQGVAVKDVNTYFIATEGNGVFRTTDGGATWEEKNKGNNFQDMRFIHITPAGNILASRQGDGLMRSDDNGESWTRSQSGIFNNYLISIQTLPNNEMWITSAGEGIFQSSDDGKHWLRVERLKNLIDLNIESFTFFEHENEYFAIVGTRNWGVWRFDTQWNDPRYLVTLYTTRTAHSMVTLSNNRVVIAVGSEGVSYTDDNGANFTPAAGLREDKNNDYEVYVKDKNVMVGLGTKGIYHSSNYGYAWEDRGETAENYSIFKEQNNKFYISYNGKLKSTTDFGQNWTTINVTDVYPSQSNFNKEYSYNDILVDGNTMYLTYSFGYVYTGTATPPPEPPTFKYSLLVSTNNGATWALHPDIAIDMPFKGIGKTQSGAIVAVNELSEIYNSVNGGVDFNKTPFNINSDNFTINFLKVDRNKVYLAGDDSLLISTDNGETFERSNFHFDQMQFKGFKPKEDARDMVFTSASSNFVGFKSNLGVYHTNDNGVTYDSINNSYPTETVRSMDGNSDGDVYIATSSIWRYVDAKGLPIPKLVSPPDKTGNLSVSPTSSGGRATAVITWEDTEKADIYEVQVSEYEQFYNFMYKKVHAGSSATLTDSLKYNTTYYWRTRSKINDSYGKWSTRWEFTTELPAPTLTYPANNDYGVPLKPTYQWDEIPNSLYYVVQLSSSTAFSDVIFSSTVTSTTFSSGTYTPENVLTPSTTYYWRAKAVSNKSESNWSDYNMFTTVTGKPTLIYPANNSTEIPTASTFKFKGVPSGTKYFIQISSDSTFQNLALLILNRETETDSTHFFDFLQYYKKYHWRVQSALSFKDEQGNEEVYKGEWSDVFSFTTGIKPPGLIAPANNAFDVPLTTKLEWDSFDGATGYHIQVSPDQSFASDYVIEDTLTTLAYDVPAGVLTNYTMYYWRMRVVLADNVAAWVSPWRFTTIMETPTQVYPECHQNDVDLQFTIVWSKVLGADKYRIQVATTPNFGQSDIVFSEEDITNDRTKIENGLEANKTYYWRTQGYNDVNTGPWSTVCDFTTLALGVEDELAKELNFIAYPNPTSDKMNFEFTLKEASKVNLEIYDMSGLKVAELLNDNVGTGTHFINWNVKGISNGTYNLIMNVNGKTYIKLVGVSK